MKVMIVIATKSMGGAERVSMHLCRWINSQPGHSAMIAVLRPKSGKTYDMSSLPTAELAAGHTLSQLIRLIRSERPDVVLSMGVPMALYTVPACKLTGVKHVISERSDPGHFSGKAAVGWLSKRLMRHADGYVFQTEEARDYYGLKKKSAVIPNPLANAEALPPQRFTGGREKKIVTAGRLIRAKNQSMLIESFAGVHSRHPDWQLWLWGTGPEEAALRKLAKEKGLGDTVRLPGASDRLMEEIYTAGLFVLSSDFEGMPNALMEAMALGLPCISTDCPCGGPHSLIQPGVNGLLVPVGDRAAMTDAMLRMIEEPELADACGRAAFGIRQTHSQDGICRAWLDFFREVAG